MSEMTTKLKNIERFEDLELGSIRILNSAIAYLTQLESENAALKSRLKEAERDMKVMDKHVVIDGKDPAEALCKICTHWPNEAGEKCSRCDIFDNSGFEWRGVQADKGKRDEKL